MRAILCGRNLDDLRETIRRFPIELVDDGADVVISYGGDGALLGAERTYPGIPKCPIRDTRCNPKCEMHSEERVLELLVAGELQESPLVKLVATGPDGQIVTGINDVLVNKEIISSAVRYRLWLDGELYKNQIVGDGMVVATPFGSTGYYRSITHSLFRVGIGLAFNNSTEPLDHLVIDEETVVEVEVIRGPAVLLADNDPQRFRLNMGERVTVKKSTDGALALGLDIFRCSDCYRLRQDGL